MDRITIPVGLLFSRTGPYGAIGENMLRGALLAVEELNADPESGVHIAAQMADPGGRNDAYIAAAQDMLTRQRLSHVIGCYTSSSRKDVMPVFEKYDGLLWYPSHYEGFETSENVIYTGASPNQHVVPLTHYMLGEGLRRCFMIGSNYIWAWENNRIMREILTRNGGQVLAERYLHVGDTNVDETIDLLLRSEPDSIFSTLIGDSSYHFLRSLRQRCEAAGIDQVRNIPIFSCSLAEPELAEIGTGACDGHLTSSVYFTSIATERNRDWLSAWARKYPGDGPASADAEASYIAVHLLAKAAREAGSVAPPDILASLAEVRFEAPQGPVWIDPENRHAWLWPRIGRSRRDGGFDLIHEARGTVRPDPYLVWEPMAAEGGAQRLRVVS